MTPRQDVDQYNNSCEYEGFIEVLTLLNKLASEQGNDVTSETVYKYAVANKDLIKTRRQLAQVVGLLISHQGRFAFDELKDKSFSEDDFPSYLSFLGVLSKLVPLSGNDVTPEIVYKYAVENRHLILDRHQLAQVTSCLSRRAGAFVMAQEKLFKARSETGSANNHARLYSPKQQHLIEPPATVIEPPAPGSENRATL